MYIETKYETRNFRKDKQNAFIFEDQNIIKQEIDQYYIYAMDPYAFATLMNQNIKHVCETAAQIQVC